MKRRRMTNAKLFISKPDGTWEEVKGVTIGPCAFQVGPSDEPANPPTLRDFSASVPLALPPLGSDPTWN
jgi:hypothetical protein